MFVVCRLLVGVLFFATVGYSYAHAAMDPGLSIQCQNSSARDAEFRIGVDQELVIKDSYINGQSEIEQYFAKILGLAASNELNLSWVKIRIPMESVVCAESLDFLLRCQGAPGLATIEVGGFVNKQNTWGKVNLVRVFDLKSFSLQTALGSATPAEKSKDPVRLTIDKMDVDGRVELMVDGRAIRLQWTPFFLLGDLSSKESSCLRTNQTNPLTPSKMSFSENQR